MKWVTTLLLLVSLESSAWPIPEINIKGLPLPIKMAADNSLVQEAEMYRIQSSKIFTDSQFSRPTQKYEIYEAENSLLVALFPPQGAAGVTIPKSEAFALINSQNKRIILSNVIILNRKYLNQFYIHKILAHEVGHAWQFSNAFSPKGTPIPVSQVNLIAHLLGREPTAYDVELDADLVSALLIGFRGRNGFITSQQSIGSAGNDKYGHLDSDERISNVGRALNSPLGKILVTRANEIKNAKPGNKRPTRIE